ncbi:hypothetical protein NUW54_g640 [Trametes sanguinea]|uniref:Uncharacterized protein n=1 Tax=Trametes sanguinea TaxID=158606 RepID=A0ACC1QAH8_9APHY|nr:hypothetical protein NUW54_g640 [Trametes sanguinea]
MILALPARLFIPTPLSTTIQLLLCSWPSESLVYNLDYCESQALSCRVTSLSKACERDNGGRVHALAQKGELEYLDYHPEKERDAAAFCVEIIKRDFGTNFAAIPPHGRWRHLDAGRPRVQPLIENWKSSPNPPDTEEICRCLIYLFLVSVLLDAGAGNAWTYKEDVSGQLFSRSEGLGVASIAMFEQGFFSSDSTNPHQVDAEGLSRIIVPQVAAAMQVSESNPMVGLEGRSSLLINLSKALKANTTYFGENPRLVTWSVRGSLRIDEKILGWKFEGLEHMTGLPEYRNGGLLVDLGVLSLRRGAIPASFNSHHRTPQSSNGVRLPSSSCTCPNTLAVHALLTYSGYPVYSDRIADEIRKQLGLTPEQLTLAQVLESATWKGGREIAKQKRPATGGPPIDIASDSRVF